LLKDSAQGGEVDALTHSIRQVAGDGAELHPLLHVGDGVGIGEAPVLLGGGGIQSLLVVTTESASTCCSGMAFSLALATR
jgi:hypothetical protein